MPTASANEHFESRAQTLLQGVKDSGQWKHLQTIESAMGPEMTLAGHGKVLCFCSNNYLGLANEGRVVQAGHEGLDRHGGGTASVRFICGTFSAHHELEQRIASFMGTEDTILYSSCFDGPIIAKLGNFFAELRKLFKVLGCNIASGFKIKAY